jgi:hypothetical protein
MRLAEDWAEPPITTSPISDRDTGKLAVERTGPIQAEIQRIALT